MGAESSLGKGQTPGDPTPPSDSRHSYEDFTQRPFYKEINRKTLALAPSHNLMILDVATGTGGMIDLMREGSVIDKIGAERSVIVGIDIDEDALSGARKKFEGNNDAVYEFYAASSESVGKEDNTFDLVTFCNAIHLTDVPASLNEAIRVLEPGGTFIANSAFVAGLAYPIPESAKFWGSLGVGAMIKARRAGYEIERNTDFITHTIDDYKRMAEESGFEAVETSVIEGRMDLDDVLAICHYDEFAKGVLKGLPLDVAHDFLARTAIELYEKLPEELKEKGIPRNWMVLTAKKPALPQAA